MTGTPFIRFPVKRPGGVLWFAAEGMSEVPIRVTAAWEKRGGQGRAPFAWTGTCPALLERGAADKLKAMIREAAEKMERDFALPVVLVIIDTLAKAAGLAKDGQLKDDTTAKIVLKNLADLATDLNLACVGIAHFGKDKERGTRGSAGFEDDSETVLAMLSERTIGGVVNGPHLVVRKRKSEENGEEFPLTVEKVCIGKSKEGKGISTLVLNWGKEDAVADAKPKQDAAWRNKGLRHLRKALMNVSPTQGHEIKPWRDKPAFRAVPLEVLRHEFCNSYPAAEATDAKKKAAARRPPFKCAVQEAEGRR